MPGNSRFTAYGKATSRLHSGQRTQRHFVYRGYQRSDRTHMAAPGTHRRRLHEAIPHCHAGLVRTAPHDEGAIVREKQIKKWNRSWKLRLIQEENPRWKDLWPDIVGQSPSMDSRLRGNDDVGLPT